MIATETTLHVRYIVRNLDMPDILRIESSTTDPYSEADFKLLLSGRVLDTVGQVADMGGLVLGHVLYSMREDEIELIRLVVDPARRERGVGRKLLERVLSKIGPDRKRTKLICRVPETNMGMLKFLSACGLRAVRVERNAFEGEDGVWMEVEP